MTNIAENIDNEYVLTVIIAIRENNKRPDIKAIKDYINKNFATDVEEELTESIVVPQYHTNWPPYTENF